jgi:hypothetical protein
MNDEPEGKVILLDDNHPMVAAFQHWLERPIPEGMEEQDQLWRAFSAGYEAAPTPKFDHIDRNYAAIAILAAAAMDAAHSDEPGTWEDWSEGDQRGAIETVMKMARGEDTLLEGIHHPVFKHVVHTALDMFDGNGGLAIEHLVDLGNFMINEMGYQPSDGEVSIAASVKEFLAKQRDELEEWRGGEGRVGALCDQAETPDPESWIRQQALEFAIKASCPVEQEPYRNVIERARAFEAFLVGSPPAEVDAAATVTSAHLSLTDTATGATVTNTGVVEVLKR